MCELNFVTEAEKKVPVKETADVCVAGGGIAGISAALAAARQGAEVLLIESGCTLGGLATLGLITVYEPLCDGFGNQVIFGIAEELLRLSIKHGYEERYPDAWLDGNDPEKRKKQRFQVRFNAQFFAMDLERILLENGVKILYRTKVYDTVVKEGKITEVLIDNKAGRSAVRASAFVDATGDADLCWFSGEDTALYEKNTQTAWYYYYYDGGYRCAATKGKTCDRFYNGLDDETDMIMKTHELIYEDVLSKKEADPCVMPVTLPNLPLILMTRRLKGISEPNLEEAEKGYEDAIGRMGNWRAPKGVYDIPYTSLYGAKIKNLITAGRCVSHKTDMWDISRVIPVCALTGEAAGVAASMVASGIPDMAGVPLAKLRKAIGYRDR